MAQRVDLDKQYIIRAFEACIASLKRSKNANNVNVRMLPIIDEDIKLYQNAINTLADSK